MAIIRILYIIHSFSSILRIGRILHKTIFADISIWKWKYIENTRTHVLTIYKYITRGSIQTNVDVSSYVIYFFFSLKHLYTLKIISVFFLRGTYPNIWSFIHLFIYLYKKILPNIGNKN